VSEAVLEGKGLTKHYGPVVAAESVDFGVFPGEIVALVGDNGAGKSTLVKMLSGATPPDRGEIVHRGERVSFASPHDARARGIETIYQDLALAQNRDVAANLFLGREVLYGGILRPFGLLNRRAMIRASDARLRELGIQLPFVAGLPVARLSGGQRQAVAVARAAAWATDVLFMDEPTAALGVKQSKAVLDLAQRIAERGVGVVLITHVMPHVMAVANRLVVLRHGRKVADLASRDVTTEELVALIVGFDPESGDGGAEPEP
jgi:simple sugar transport system ATP-binding protein